MADPTPQSGGNAGQGGVKPEYVTHITTTITWATTNTAFPGQTFRYTQILPGAYSRANFSDKVNDQIVSVEQGAGKVEATDKTFNKCISGTQCATGYECVEGRCQPVGECQDMIPSCSDFCINQETVPSENEPSCGVGDPNSTYTVGCDEGEDDSEVTDCSKFCDEWSKLAGVLKDSSIKDCKPDDACSVCKTCYKGLGKTYSGIAKDGLCVNQTGDARPCYCPSYIDDDTGKFVDTQSGRDCQLCNTQQGNWYNPDESTGICSKFCSQTMVCDCGKVISTVAQSRDGGADACVKARQILTEECNKICQVEPCPYPEQACNFAGPIQVGTVPSLNYPCPKGWNCYQSSDSRLGKAPEGTYYYYTCPYPGWPDITIDQLRDADGCNPCGNNCRSSTVVTNSDETPDCELPLCRITGSQDAGDGQVTWYLKQCDDNSNQADVPLEERCFPISEEGRYQYIFKTASESYEYFPCSCEVPIGESIQIPGGIIHKRGVRANWPFNPIEEVETCRVDSSVDPGGSVRCFGFGAGFTLRELCSSYNKYDQRRRWRTSGTVLTYDPDTYEESERTEFAEFDTGETLWTIEYAFSRPYLNHLGTYFTEGFDTSGKPIVIYDVPGLPWSEQPPRCSDEPEPVALIDFDLNLLLCSEATYDEIMQNDDYNQFIDLPPMAKSWELGYQAGTPPQPLSDADREQAYDSIFNDGRILPPSPQGPPTIEGPESASFYYGDGLILALSPDFVSTPSSLIAGTYVVPLVYSLGGDAGRGSNAVVELIVFGAEGNLQSPPTYDIKILDRGAAYAVGDQVMIPSSALLSAGATSSAGLDLTLTVDEIFTQEIPEELKDKPRYWITTLKAPGAENFRFTLTKTQQSSDSQFSVDSEGQVRMPQPSLYPADLWGVDVFVEIQAIRNGRWSENFELRIQPRLVTYEAP